MKNFTYDEINEFFSYGKESCKELFSKMWYRQIPNLLTFSRAISPFIVIPLVMMNKIITSFWVIGIFALTDALDGLIARRFNLISHFGRKLDPVCDKIFAINAIIPLVRVYHGLYISILFELLIASVNIISCLKGNSPKTSQLGRIKTISLSITIVLGYLILLNKKVSGLYYFFIGLTAFLQIMALGSYYMIDKKKSKMKSKQPRKAAPHLEKNTINVSRSKKYEKDTFDNKTS